jgi:DME family drug/metabolite transporter
MTVTGREMEPSTISKGYLIAIAATMVWSFTGILIRYLTDVIAMPVLVMAAWRDALVAATLVVIFLVFNRSRFTIAKEHIPFLIVYGFILSLYNMLWTLSVKFNGAAVSTVLVYISPAITALIERWFFAEKMNLRQYVAIAISIVGVAFVADAFSSQVWELNFWGLIVGMLSGLGMTAFSLAGRETARRDIDTWTALLYSFAIAAGFILLYDLISNGMPLSGIVARMFWLGDSTKDWSLLILLAVGPTLGGYGLYTLSLRYLQATVSNLIATLEPPLTTVEAYILLGERLTLPQIFGSLLILGSVILLRLKKRKKVASRQVNK